jgi:hypothetical protein
MRRLGHVVGIVVTILGLWIALWGAHDIFQLMLGSALPWQAGDPVPMTIFTGIAFVRVFGAVLMGLGAVLWATQRQRNRERTIKAALFASALLATLVAIAQQIAIWSGMFGYVLIGALVLVALVSVAGLTDRRENGVRGNVV